MQSTSSILMIRPAAFGYDPDTAATNGFQQAPEEASPVELHASALREFDALVEVLRDHGLGLHVIDDTASPAKPDAIFPNNWITTHEDGTVILYPMMSRLRREERRREILEELEQYYEMRQLIDLSYFEDQDQFLEGTGSMVLDRENGVIFACRSPRTNEEVLRVVARHLRYEPILFDAFDSNGKPVYHTNVLLTIGTQFAVVAESTLPAGAERDRLMAALGGNGRRLVKLRPNQLWQFAGNMLEVQGRDRLVALSSAAYESLSDAQRDLIELFARLVHAPIPTIERVGGGSLRCMLAEVFLPRK